MTATNDLQSPLARLQADFARQHDHERQEAGSSSSSQPGVPSSSRPDALRRALQEDYNPFRASIDSTSTYGGPGWLDRRDSISSASVYSTSSAFTLTPSDPARRSEYFYHPSHDEERHLQVVQRRDSEGRRSLAGEVGVAHVFGQSKPTAPSSIAARPRRAAPPPPTIPEANGSSPRLAGSPRLAPARHPPGPSRQASESSFRSTASAAADGLPPGEHQLSLGIKSHQRGQLAESALHFRKSAEAGNTAGALLFGLSLRHGWGVVQDERQGLIYLERAVEASTARAPDGSIVVKPPVAGTPVRPELVTALYELGNSYLQGWGPKQADVKLAMAYYRAAAELGDRDAQEQLGFLLSSNGGKQHGVKRDMREAARWYRSAVAQGASDVGLSWIHKDKYR